MPHRHARVWLVLVALGLAACGEKEQLTEPPLPPPPVDDSRPVDPGLSFALACLVDGPVQNNLGGNQAPGSIPALVDPAFVDADDAGYVFPNDLVFGVELENRYYAFPARILNYHEIVTFSIEEGRYAATWCPLSYSFVLVENTNWDASSPSRVASYIVSGSLMDNNLIIFDFETETTWPQVVLKGLAGSRADDCLDMGRNGVATTWEFWRRLHPETVVLTNQNERQTAIRPEFYFTNPYEDYWEERIQPVDWPVWPVLNIDDRLPLQEIVLGVHGNGGKAAVLITQPVAMATVGSTPVVFFHDAASRTTFAFENALDGVPRGFEAHDPDENGIPRFKDTRDGTVWSIEGIGLEGPQAGRRLAQMPSLQLYWFVWATFFPNTLVLTL